MNDKRIPLTDEEPKHKKKSNHKGLPRSKHKHQYETVLLSRFYHYKDINNGKDKVSESRIPTKVCMICGRIDEADNDPSYYTYKPVNPTHPWVTHTKELSDKALSLTKWYVLDYFGKFANKGTLEISADSVGCLGLQDLFKV